MFSSSYVTFETNDGKGQGFRITCTPARAGSISSSEGYKLKKVVLTMVVLNVSNPNQVAYVTGVKSFYEGINEKGIVVSKTSESIKEGVLNSPAIDLTQDPVLFIVDEGSHEIVAVFKNSFPYSQLQQ